jgi:intracellular septation protein
MKFLLDFLPIIAFFVTYKLRDSMNDAIIVTVIITALQVSITWIVQRRLEKMHIVTLVLVTFLGVASIYFGNELFFKWKPTVINWLFAMTFMASHFIGHSTILERLMGEQLELNKQTWQKLSVSWIVFFAFLGALNLYVVYNFSTDTWVNFKLFGTLAITLLFVVIQAVYLSQHMHENGHTREDAKKR